MIFELLSLVLFIVQCSSAAVIANSSNLLLNNELLPTSELPSESARNLSPHFNDQSVKLLNFNINSYLASLNRFNGQNGNVPSKEQLMAAAANLINANNILVNNPSLANYQTLSGLINNNNNYSSSILNNVNKPPVVASKPPLPPISNLPAPMINLPTREHPSLAPQSISPVNHMINNKPNSINVPPVAPMINNQPPSPQLANNVIPSSPSPTNILATQPLHASNRISVNTASPPPTYNNANKAFDLSNEEERSLMNSSNLLTGGNEPANYLTFNGENSMPEHWKLLITGMQKFSLNLIKSLHNFEPKDSSAGIILSPFSIWSTLVVTYMGAKTETEREMADVLYLRNVPKETVLMAYRGLKEWYDLRCRNMNITKPLNDDLAMPNSKMNFCSLANRVFFNSNLQLNRFVKENFAQETQSMDFVHEIEKSRQAINHWIEQKTMNKIKDLIAPGSINSFTNIVIANAIYFQAKWLTQFESQKTVKRKFQVNPTEEITVNYMRQTANFMYGISESIKSTILEMPYSNQEFSMVLILPEPQLGIDSLVKQIKVEHLDEIFMNLYDDEVEVQIPKFKFEQEFELAGPLYSMGIKRVFDPRFSDFSGFLEPQNITTTPENNSTEEINDVNNSSNEDYFNNKINKKVIINSVVHKAFISIDEEGTEAAAATSLLIARSGRPAFPSQFIANRPFMFLVRDTTTNAISFMGIVRRPSTE